MFIVEGDAIWTVQRSQGNIDPREQISGAGHHGSENIAKKFLQAKGVPIRQCLAIAQGSSVKLSCCQRGCLTELLFAIRKHGVREFRSDLRKTLVDCVG